MSRTYHLSMFGIWLKQRLAERHMTQRDLADLLDTSEVNISRYIHGDRFPRQSVLNAIMNIFGCHIEILQDRDKQT